MILDTAFVVDVLRGDADALERHRELGERGEQRLSAMSVLELFDGVERSLDSRTEVVTRDVDDFEQFENVEVRTY